MFYKPHILQKKVVVSSRDEYGRPIVSEGGWVDVCQCRCDDNTTTEFHNENGLVYRPSYHVVCEGMVDVKAGEEIRCLNADGSIRGEGKCERPRRLNFLGYSELWM